MSTTALQGTYEMCVRGYIRIMRSNWTGAGRVESLALDGVRFVLICRILGISTGRLDPILTRYEPYLHQELEKLHRSFEIDEGCAMALTEEFVKPHHRSSANNNSDMIVTRNHRCSALGLQI